ncbi:MAG: lamin tail domain-containing protein [bacterium]
MKRSHIIVALCFCLVAAAAQVYGDTIAEVKEINASGLPVKLGQIVDVSGTVTVANGTFNDRDLDIHIQDETGGIYVSLRNGVYIDARLGDSVVVTGLVDQEGRTPRRNHTKLSLLSADGIQVVGEAAFPVPIVVTAAELAQPAQPPLEQYEGRLVRVEGLSINPEDWPTAPGGDKWITATDATGSLQIRLDKDTDIPGSEAPSDPFIIIGVIIQDSSNPLTGYHVWPRSRYADFLDMGNGSGLASVDPDVVETDVEEFDLDVTLKGNGVDTITAFEIGLPLDDGWGWELYQDNLSLSGPGLEGVTWVEITDSGVIVRGAEILDEASYGTVTFEGMTPPARVVNSTVEISTSVDGETFDTISSNPVIGSLLPLADVVVNEVYPDDGTTSSSSAFIELKNRSGWTAHLEGFTLSDLKTAAHCSPVARLTFGASDSISPGGYLVIAESEAGFEERFGSPPDIGAGISPLGRVGGDGASVAGVDAYEVVALWRGAVSGQMVDHCEYKSPLIVLKDICIGVGGDNDAFPIVPPVGYSLARDEEADDVGASDIDFIMSSEPTPGEENVPEDSAPPEIEEVVMFSLDVVEVRFNEPCDSVALADPSAYYMNGEEPVAVYVALTLQKVALLFEGFESGIPATLTVTEMVDIAGNTAENLMFEFTTSGSPATRICQVQEFDEKGFSPMRGDIVSVIGFITVPQGVFQSQYNSIYIQGLDGCGVNVFSYDPPSPNPGAGYLVKVTGEVEEYVSGTAGATTELYMGSPNAEVLLSGFYPVPDAVVMKTGEIGHESNEGKLIATEGAIVSANDFGFYVNDGSGGIQVYQNYTDIDYSQFRVGMYVKVQGVILQYDRTIPFLDGYELVPRRDSDIIVVEEAYPGEALLDVEPRVFCPSCGEYGFTVRFSAPQAAQVTLRIFDGKGRLVKTLFSGLSVGEGEKVWDGLQPGGEPVEPGLYICFLDSVEEGTGRRTTDSAPIVVGVQLK